MRAALTKQRIAVLAVAALALAGCGRKDKNNSGVSSGSRPEAAMDTGAVPSSGASPSGWTDANIFALLDESNAADSTEGALAAIKATSAQLRDFAKLMMSDHHAMRLEGQALAKKLGITPVPSADDKSQANLQKYIGLLTATAKGKDFDRAYIGLQLDAHKTVLEKATKAMAATQNAELKNLLQKSAPRVLAHLDKAEALEKGMK